MLVLPVPLETAGAAAGALVIAGAGSAGVCIAWNIVRGLQSALGAFESRADGLTGARGVSAIGNFVRALAIP